MTNRRLDPDRLAVAPEDPGAERVERARLDLAAGLADEAMIRSRSSPAARLVNVTARIGHGRTFLTPTR